MPLCMGNLRKIHVQEKEENKGSELENTLKEFSRAKRTEEIK